VFDNQTRLKTKPAWFLKRVRYIC